MKCFVDTTVLTDALLGDKKTRSVARAALGQFSVQLVPEYAHKEFKIGALKNFLWLYKKFVTTQSYVLALKAIQSLSRTQHRYKTSTGIQALMVAAEKLLGQQVVNSGRMSAAEADRRMARMYELELKRIIILAWNNRNRIGELFEALDCYPRMQIDTEVSPFTTLPDNCPLELECCLKTDLARMNAELGLLRAALNGMPSKKENVRRNAALKQLQKKPTEFFGRDLCRNLGDAYFVLRCPANCSILTTNRNDFPDLAAALGKTVSFP